MLHGSTPHSIGLNSGSSRREEPLRAIGGAVIGEGVWGGSRLGHSRAARADVNSRDAAAASLTLKMVKCSAPIEHTKNTRGRRRRDVSRPALCRRRAVSVRLQ